MTPCRTRALNSASRFGIAASVLTPSGGLHLSNARKVAETGVDYLAVGALTHSSRALDLGLDYRES